MKPLLSIPLRGAAWFRAWIPAFAGMTKRVVR